jgi:hypothetical protein
MLITETTKAFSIITLILLSRNSSVDIVTGYMLNRQGIRAIFPIASRLDPRPMHSITNDSMEHFPQVENMA